MGRASRSQYIHHTEIGSDGRLFVGPALVHLLSAISQIMKSGMRKGVSCFSGRRMPTHKLEDKFRDPDTRATDTWLSLGLAFVGGYGDAASFVLAKTFTGHVTGNLVLGAIALAAHDWRASLGHLSPIVSFLRGIALSVVMVRPYKAWQSWPLLPTIMGIEVILIVAASLALAAQMAHGVEIFVIFMSLALGLQNGSFHRVGVASLYTRRI
jgi:hypothetical protein